jgi:hypothetical protein
MAAIFWRGLGQIAHRGQAELIGSRRIDDDPVLDPFA